MGREREMELEEWEPMDEAELDAIEAAAVASSSRSKRSTPSPSSDLSSPSKTFRRLPPWPTDGYCLRSRGPPAQLGLGLDPHTPPPLRSNGFWKLSPPSCRATPKARYPFLTFGGRIVYSRTAPEVEKATRELLEIVRAKKQNADSIAVGFDIEWRPTFRRGEGIRRAAVIQLCANTSHCYVMHIIHSGIPPTLQAFLEDDSFIKVGVCIINDAIKIAKDYNVHVEALDDLSGLANRKLGGMPKKWSLCSLTEILTSKQLAKPNKIRLGNWEVDVLSKEQLAYAATDAFASWYLYEALKSYPDATKDENPGMAAQIGSP